MKVKIKSFQDFMLQKDTWQMHGGDIVHELYDGELPKNLCGKTIFVDNKNYPYLYNFINIHDWMIDDTWKEKEQVLTIKEIINKI